MQITRLRLLGFKSFVEPTELVIEKGLTGVVGPNGCGKSNLLEALRWSMGETSYKSMRAAAMEDVIFSGTTTRPARNMAEVTSSSTTRPAPRRPSSTTATCSRSRGGSSATSARPTASTAATCAPATSHPVRGRRDRRALAGARPAGPDRRDRQRQARAAPPHPGGCRRRRRSAQPPARRGAAAQGGGRQSRAARRHRRPARRRWKA